MSQQLTTFEGPNEGHRILIAASDAESVSMDLLENEASIVRESLAEYKTDGLQIRTISTLEQDVFVRELQNFQPNTVHFTNRGSAQSCIRMISGGGWIRQITGKTIAGMFIKAGCFVQTIVLMNCSVYREEASLLLHSDFTLSIRNRIPTFGVSPGVIRELYRDLGRSENYGKFLSRFEAYVSELAPEDAVNLEIRGKEIPGGLSREGRASFQYWELPKSLVEPGFEKKGGIAGPGTRPSSQVDFLVDDGRRRYRVWFGTNRKPIAVDRPGEFGSDRDEVTHYGHCDVVIPKHHKIGQVSDSWLKRTFWSGDSNSLKIDCRTTLSSEGLFTGLRKVFKDLSDDEDNLLVFLHGYNVSFDQAAIRTAQLGVDLSVKGATAFFSWPSKGKYLGYMADEATIEASEGPIAEFLIRMSQESGARRMHIIAHSMGNRGLLRALNSLLHRVQMTIGPKMGQIFLAAPDVDAKVFKTLANAYSQICQRATMYVCAKDKALWGSSFFHAYERAGYTPPITVVPSIDTVEVSNLNLDLLGHGYVSDAKEVLVDMHTLMKSNDDPDKRFGLKKMKTVDGNDYWLVRA